MIKHNKGHAYRQAGFTLIELLVVIAIIGILSSIVLASLNTSRGKGQDAKVKAQLSGLRSSAEVYYDTNGNYGGVVTSDCAAGMFADTDSGVATYTNATNYPVGATMSCNSTNIAYAVSALLPGIADTLTSWCVDSTGSSKQIGAPLGDNDTDCD